MPPRRSITVRHELSPRTVKLLAEAMACLFSTFAQGSLVSAPNRVHNKPVTPTPTLRISRSSDPDWYKPLVESWSVSMRSRGKRATSISRFRRLVERMIDWNNWR